MSFVGKERVGYGRVGGGGGGPVGAHDHPPNPPLCVAGAPLASAISGGDGSSSSNSTPHYLYPVVGTEANRVLYVGFSSASGTSANVRWFPEYNSTISVGPEYPFTKILALAHGGGFLEIWRLIDPAPSTGSNPHIRLDDNSGSRQISWFWLILDANRSAPEYDAKIVNGSGSQADVSVTPGASALILDCVSRLATASDVYAPVALSGQTVIASRTEGSTFGTGNNSAGAGRGGSAAASWRVADSGAYAWAAAALAVRPVDPSSDTDVARWDFTTHELDTTGRYVSGLIRRVAPLYSVADTAFGANGGGWGETGPGGSSSGRVPISGGTQYRFTADHIYQYVPADRNIYVAFWDGPDAGATLLEEWLWIPGTGKSIDVVYRSDDLHTSPAGATHLNFRYYNVADHHIDNIGFARPGIAAAPEGDHPDLVGDPLEDHASRCGHAHHLLRAVAPTVNDDANDGIPVTTQWTDTVTNRSWLNTDNTAGAAVWIQYATGDHGGTLGRTDDDHPQYSRWFVQTAEPTGVRDNDVWVESA